VRKFNTVKIREESYEKARRQAEKEGESIAEVISKAIEGYVESRQDLEERARLLIRLLDEEKKRGKV
jgi:hypothetical protein